jgi:type 1 glutamine amidotransferase
MVWLRSSCAAALLLAAAVAPSAQAPPPKNVLYVTQSAGFKHDVLPLSEQVLAEIGRKHGFDVRVSHDASTITAESLTPYAAVVFYTTGELPISEAGKRAFMSWLKSGRGFVGIHSATDTFYQWPEYGEMIGGYFDQHPWTTQVTMKVEDHEHPSTKHLGPTWTLADEIYQFKNYSRDKVRVLIRLDEKKLDLKNKNVHRTDGDFAVTWVKNYGKGRVFYSTLGHREEVYDMPEIKKMYIEAVKWVLGMTEGATTPHAKPAATD